MSAQSAQRQTAILETVERLSRESGGPVRTLDVVAATGLAPSSLHYHVVELEKRGLLARRFGGRALERLQASEAAS